MTKEGILEVLKAIKAIYKDDGKTYCPGCGEEVLWYQDMSVAGHENCEDLTTSEGEVIDVGNNLYNELEHNTEGLVMVILNKIEELKNGK